MNELALFAGAGGGILGGHLLGWRTVCAVEFNPYAASVLAARQNDGVIAPFPIWDDVCTFDGKPWRGIVDVVSGGFPCQDISAAGSGVGITGSRSGLWSEMARIVSEVRPRFVFVENSPMLTSRGLGVVLGDLAALGFDAQWGVVSAADTGAPHLRERIWIVANARGGRCGEPSKGEMEQSRRAEAIGASSELADASRAGCAAGRIRSGSAPDREIFDMQSIDGGQQRCRNRQGWPAEPGLGRVADGVAARVDRIKAIGNGQVPRVAAAAWSILNKVME